MTAERREIQDLATPGPWEAVVLGSEGYAIMGPPYENRPGRRRVARCGDTDWEQDKANALLIARAPDLLAENKRLRKALALWQEFAMDASSMYESSLRYNIPRVSAAARELSHSGRHSEADHG